MSKAEEKAYEVYPKMSRITESHGVIPADNKSHYLGDGNEEKREGFIEGYFQAEKDLELTWEDIKKIYFLFKDVRNEWQEYEFNDCGICREVLKRFKEKKQI